MVPEDDALDARLEAAEAKVARLQQALDRQREQFEAQMRKRTAALQKARLEAEALSESKSEFLATMSHEIRTPIHGIMGTLDLLAETQLAADQQDFLGTARGSAESLLRIVNDILDFSKIEAGKLDIELTTVELRSLVEEVTSSLAPLAFGKGVEVVCDIHPEVPEKIIADSVRLGQILTNLYGNAVKFTNQGQVLVAVRLDLDEQGERFVRFDVNDTGIGIERQRQKTLFQPFIQADGSTSRQFGGTGLGLAISLRLAKLMGGRISLRSAPGRGSRFSLKLPLELPHSADPAVAAAAPQLDGKILVFDENNASAAAISRILWQLGIQAHLTTSKADAVAALEAASDRQAFKGLILDAGGSEASARRLLEELRAVPGYQDTPAALLGGHFQHVADWGQLDVVRTIPKPVRYSHLADAVNAMLGDPQAASHSMVKKVSEAEPLEGKVLLVDDNQTNRKIAIAMMAKIGIDPDIAENGLEALNAVKQHSYDLVLMDVQMPVMNGLEATAAIRELDGEACNVPIVAMTANAMPEDREICLSAGMDDYLPKPVRGKRLREVLHRWLKESMESSDTMDPAETILRPHHMLMSSDAGAVQQGGMLGLLSRFVDSLDSRIAAFADLYKENDFRALATGARGIRTDAEQIGAARLASLAALLETACEQADYESADRYARRLPRVARETTKAIRQHLEKT